MKSELLGGGYIYGAPPEETSTETLFLGHAFTCGLLDEKETCLELLRKMSYVAPFDIYHVKKLHELAKRNPFMPGMLGGASGILAVMLANVGKFPPRSLLDSLIQQDFQFPPMDDSWNKVYMMIYTPASEHLESSRRFYDPIQNHISNELMAPLRIHIANGTDFEESDFDGGVMGMIDIVNDTAYTRAECLKLTQPLTLEEFNLEQYREEMEEFPMDVPDYLTCPISMSLFEDPVMVLQSGQTYSRSSIERSMMENPYTDPFTNERFDEPLLIKENFAIKRVLEDHFLKWKKGYIGRFYNQAKMEQLIENTEEAMYRFEKAEEEAIMAEEEGEEDMYMPSIQSLSSESY